MCWSLFLIYLPPTDMFTCDYCVIFKNTYFEEHLQTAASERNGLRTSKKVRTK